MYLKQLFLLLSGVVTCWGSVGDRSVPYKRCMHSCESQCGDNDAFMMNQPLHMRLLAWNCNEECKYSCMWKAIEFFQQNNYSIPQFHGKWPFARLAGIQEPASVLFSFLNGITVWIGFKRFLHFVPSTAPMYKLTVLQFFLSENAWFWSIVFHSRDFYWTEQFDYFCATSLVLFTLFFCLYRWSFDLPDKLRSLFRVFAANLFVAAYLGHVSYLSFVKFDYEYNMKFNITFGIASCLLCILFWCFKRHKLPYAWKLPATSVVGCLLLGFEVLDFPPWFWILDAHSIWHLSTVPLQLGLYSFIVDDQLHMLKID